MEADYRLQTIRVDALNLTHDSDLNILLLFLWNRHVRGGVVLLVAHENVGH